MVVLAIKSQDTAGALERAARGCPARDARRVHAERGRQRAASALRLFENVYGAVVMLPAAHIEPGVVRGPCQPR